MKNIINYFNENAFLASLITLTLSFAFTWFTRHLDKKDKKKSEDLEKVIKRGQFRINNRYEKKFIDRFALTFTTYDTVYFEKQDETRCVYDKRILDNYESEYKRVYLENIGDCNIQEIVFVVTDKKRSTLCMYDDTKKLIKSGKSCSVVRYQNVLKPNEAIQLFVNVISDEKFKYSDFKVYYRDAYGNYYFQSISLYEPSIEDSHKITDTKFLEDTNEIDK